MQRAVKVYLMFAVLLICSQQLFAVEYEVGFSAKEKLAKEIKKESVLNPDNLLGLGYPLCCETALHGDVEIYVNNHLTVNGSDSVFFTYENNEDGAEEKHEYEVENRVKELYSTLYAGDALLVDIGRKIEKNGVSYYTNPTDFLIDDEIAILGNDEADEKREGDLMARGELLVGSSFSFSLLYAPPTEYVSELSTRSEGITQGAVSWQGESMDLNLIFHYSDMWCTGTNYSANIGDSIEVHAEIALLQKSCRTMPELLGDEYYTLEEEEYAHPMEAVLGSVYTFQDGSAFHCEYYYNGRGFSRDQWESYNDIIDEAGDLVLPQNYQTIAAANGAFAQNRGFTFLRQHYFFLRYSKTFLADEKLEIAVMGMTGLEELGGFAGISPSYEINDHLLTNIDVTMFGGEEGSEFDLFYQRAVVSGCVEYVF